jgi:hypothetical protein
MTKKLQQSLPPATQGNGQGMTPKKVEKKWVNGQKDTQMIAWMLGDDSLLKVSPGGVKIGAMKSRSAGDIGTPVGSDFSYAQAEFFYDCAGKWKDNDCNGKDGDGEETMWHFRWRARLRRYNTPYEDLVHKLQDMYLTGAKTEFALHAAQWGLSANSVNLLSKNPARKNDLKDAIMTLKNKQGIH